MNDEIVSILDAMARDVVEMLTELDEEDAVAIYACKDGSYEVLSISDETRKETVVREGGANAPKGHRDSHGVQD